MAKNKKTAKNSVRKPLTLWQKVACLIGAAVVIGLILSVALYKKDEKPVYASAELQLTFEGAAEGKAPDGYTFHVEDLSSDEVITKALEASSLSDKYTADQIRSALVVAGGYPADIVGQTMSYDSLLNLTASRTLTVDRFHPTLFRVTLYDRFDKSISKAKLNELLKNLLTIYKERFTTVYAGGAPTADVTFSLTDYDYPQQLEILSKRLTLLQNYAEEMYDRDPSFRYNGNSFNDIVARIASLLDSDIGRLNATMTLNALTKDPERLKTQYLFELRDHNNRLGRRKDQLTELDKLIDSYEKSEIIYISTEQSLTKIDGDSTKTYDTLIDLRKNLATDNTLIGSKISTYRLKLSDLTGEEYLSDGTVAPEDEPGERENDTPDGTDGDNANTDETGDNTGDADVTDTKKETVTLSPEVLQRRKEAFEKDLNTLSVKTDSVSADFATMVKAWNDSKLNDLSVTVSNYRYEAPRILSGAFIKSVIKTTGPIVVIAVIISLSMIIALKKRELKAL